MLQHSSGARRHDHPWYQQHVVEEGEKQSTSCQCMLLLSGRPQLVPHPHCVQVSVACRAVRGACTCCSQDARFIPGFVCASSYRIALGDDSPQHRDVSAGGPHGGWTPQARLFVRAGARALVNNPC